MKGLMRLKKHLFLLLVLSFTLFGAIGARADWINEVPFTTNLIVPAGPGYNMPLKQMKGAKNLKVTCKENISVDIWSEKDSGSKYPVLDIRSRNKKGTFVKKGKGTAVITGTVKGKKKTLKVKFNLVDTKYTSPVKSVTIGSLNLTNDFKKASGIQWEPEYHDLYNEETGDDQSYSTANPNWEKIFGKKITVKPKSGWKLIRITQGVGTKTVTLKNGKGTIKRFDAVNGGGRISILLQNKKSGLLRILTIS